MYSEDVHLPVVGQGCGLRDKKGGMQNQIFQKNIKDEALSIVKQRHHTTRRKYHEILKGIIPLKLTDTNSQKIPMN